MYLDNGYNPNKHCYIPKEIPPQGEDAAELSTTSYTYPPIPLPYQPYEDESVSGLYFLSEYNFLRLT
jgi:hypothetical protein